MKYRKKPVEIDATRWDGTVKDATRVVGWILDGGGTARYHDPEEATPAHLAIDTLEGTMRATAGDWIIRGVRGEHYSCRGDIFAETYEPVAP